MKIKWSHENDRTGQKVRTGKWLQTKQTRPELDNIKKARKNPGLRWATGWRSTGEGAEHWVYCSEKDCETLTMLWLPKLLPKRFERKPFICGYCTAEKIYCLSETVKPEVLRPSFASIAKNEPSVPHNELTPIAAGSIRIEAHLRPFIVTGIIIEDTIFVLEILGIIPLDIISDRLSVLFRQYCWDTVPCTPSQICYSFAGIKKIGGECWKNVGVRFRSQCWSCSLWPFFSRKQFINFRQYSILGLILF